jgi:hypothetical protein
MKFLCFRCEEIYPTHQIALDVSGRLVCICCYLENPSPVDVDGVFAEVAARFEREAEQ